MVLLVEIGVFILAQKGLRDPQIAVYNIFSLADCLLFTTLFYQWSLFHKSRRTLFGLIGGFFFLWVILTFFVHGFTESNWYFRLIYSFALIFFSVTYFNKLVVGAKSSMLRNSRFLICLGLIIFYTFFTIVCATSLSLFGSDTEISKEFKRGLQTISIYSNVFVNLLYALAVLWIPRKKSFTTVY